VYVFHEFVHAHTHVHKKALQFMCEDSGHLGCDTLLACHTPEDLNFHEHCCEDFQVPQKLHIVWRSVTI